MKRRQFSRSLIFLMLIFPVSMMAQQSVGVKLLSVGKTNAAKSYFLNLVREKPTDPEAYYMLGEIYFSAGKLDSSEIYYNKANALVPAYPYAYIGKGKILFNQNKPKEAKEQFEKALTLVKYKSTDVYIALAKAVIAGDVKDYGLEEEYITKAKALKVDEPLIYLAHADALMQQNKVGDAANEYDRVLFYDKNNVEANYRLGLIYAAARNNDLAYKYLLTSVQLDSNYAPAHKSLGDMYYAAGQYSKSRESYSAFMRSGEPAPADYVRYVSVLYFNKEYQASLDESNKILKTDPSNMVVLRIRAYDYYELKDFTNGLKAIEEFFKVADPKKVIAGDHEYYGKLLMKNGKDSLGIIEYEAAIKADSSKGDLYESIAQTLEKQKKFIKAIDNWNKLIVFRGGALTSDLFQLGRSYYLAASSTTLPVDTNLRKVMLLKADSLFGQVAVQAPSSHLGVFWRARANSLLDPETELGLAEPYYKEAIKIMEADSLRYKKELIEAYQYEGYYYYLKKDNPTSKEYWNKILVLDPNDAKAKEALNGMK